MHTSDPVSGRFPAVRRPEEPAGVAADGTGAVQPLDDPHSGGGRREDPAARMILGLRVVPSLPEPLRRGGGGRGRRRTRRGRRTRVSEELGAMEDERKGGRSEGGRRRRRQSDDYERRRPESRGTTLARLNGAGEVVRMEGGSVERRRACMHRKTTCQNRSQLMAAKEEDLGAPAWLLFLLPVISREGLTQ